MGHSGNTLRLGISNTLAQARVQLSGGAAGGTLGIEEGKEDPLE